MKKLKLKKINEIIGWRAYVTITLLAIVACVFIVIPFTARLSTRIPIDMPAIAYDIIQYATGIAASLGLTLLILLRVLPHVAKRDFFSPIPKATYATRYYVASNVKIVDRIASEELPDAGNFLCVEYSIDDIIEALSHMASTGTRSYMFEKSSMAQIQPMISLKTATQICKIMKNSSYKQKAYLFYPKGQQYGSSHELTHIVA